jgi:hypothetical protein
MAEEILLCDICTPARFVENNPNLFEGEGTPKMDTLVRNRHVNGLSDVGAIIEPAQRRPMIVIPKFLKWMLSRKGGQHDKKYRQGCSPHW